MSTPTNRQIKFRGKRLDTGEWVYGYYVVRKGLSYIVKCTNSKALCYFEVNPNTVGQFLSLQNPITDEYIEAYEGDMFEDENGDIAEIIWQPYLGRFTFKGWSDEIDELIWNMKKVGNKWDNPELLKGQDEK